MVPRAHGSYPMALPGMMSSFCTGLPGMPPVYPPLCLRHGSLLSIPFRSHRRLPACGGSLFRAYRMRAPAPAFAPARLCAPDCARELSAGRRSPARSVGVFFAPARGRRRSGLRMPLPPVSFYHGFTGVKPNLGIISFFYEQIVIFGHGPDPAVREALSSGRPHPRRVRPDCERRAGRATAVMCNIRDEAPEHVMTCNAMS